jgi:hypothetical protein
MARLLAGGVLVLTGLFLGSLIGELTVPEPPMPVDRSAIALWGADRVFLGALIGATVGLALWVVWLALQTRRQWVAGEKSGAL